MGARVKVTRPTVQDDVRVRSTAQIAGHPIHPMLVPIPITCFVGALLTDIAYVASAEIMWANCSAWLLLAGIVFGVLAAIAGLIDFLGNRLVRAQAPAWPHLIGNAVVLILSIVNLMIHMRDGWTSVWPSGLALSALTVLILPITGWLGWALVCRHGVGVAR
ncbi:putative membrane protein [Bradyrhizobium yuanmingense]|uniref:Membrane protein n=1 Tax=Bradyrhizobium yuanmingense TaxID=108015 RepID=A0ABV4GQG7_9BRAD